MRNLTANVTKLLLNIGTDTFHASLQTSVAPRSCALLERLLPYESRLIHARWSGQACWSPLSSVWPAETYLPPEDATAYPAPGQILLYGGDLSEPELLIPYGPTRFGSKAGTLAGNPVLVIERRLDRLAELGHHILWGGAALFRLERVEEN